MNIPVYMTFNWVLSIYVPVDGNIYHNICNWEFVLTPTVDRTQKSRIFRVPRFCKHRTILYFLRSPHGKISFSAFLSRGKSPHLFLPRMSTSASSCTTDTMYWHFSQRLFVYYWKCLVPTTICEKQYLQQWWRRWLAFLGFVLESRRVPLHRQNMYVGLHMQSE